MIDYMVTMATGSTISRNYFPDFLLPKKDVRRTSDENEHVPFKDENDSDLFSKAVQHAEKKIIRDVLRRAKNKSKAIKILGTSRRTFYSKLKKYNIV